MAWPSPGDGDSAIAPLRSCRSVAVPSRSPSVRRSVHMNIRDVRASLERSRCGDRHRRLRPRAHPSNRPSRTTGTFAVWRCAARGVRRRRKRGDTHDRCFDACSRAWRSLADAELLCARSTGPTRLVPSPRRATGTPATPVHLRLRLAATEGRRGRSPACGGRGGSCPSRSRRRDRRRTRRVPRVGPSGRVSLAAAEAELRALSAADEAGYRAAFRLRAEAWIRLLQDVNVQLHLAGHDAAERTPSSSIGPSGWRTTSPRRP